MTSATATRHADDRKNVFEWSAAHEIDGESGEKEDRDGARRRLQDEEYRDDARKRWRRAVARLKIGRTLEFGVRKPRRKINDIGNFISSAGWKLSGPRRSQRVEPLAAVPSGVNTSMNNTILMSNRMNAIFLNL